MTLNFSHHPIFPSGFSMLEGVPEVSHCNWGFDDSHDIIDLLPSDPFGMDIGATFTAFTSWLSDNEADGWNIFLNEAMMFQADPQNLWVFQRPEVVQLSTSTSCSNISGGDPQDALLFALGYVGVQDLLSVEGVCKFLRDSVRGDPLLWKSIHIDESLNEKIDDEALLLLTSRAQGNLQCLSLSECMKITDAGLKRVLQSNPKLTKLSVPGCKRLSIEGIVNNLKDFKSSGAPGISSLRIGGRYVTDKHFEELKNLLVVDECLPRKVHTPRFFHDDQSSCDDDRLIDIEMCPKCGSFKLVYDCPAEGCRGKLDCRACIICVARCIQCGMCITGKYIETFCLDFLCYDCDKQQFCEYQRLQEESSTDVDLDQNSRYYLHLDG